MMTKYNPQQLEKKWQRFWESRKVYRANNQSHKPKQYTLIEFPYPSGEGLHMGHLRPYIAGDVFSRHMRMKGREVMYPMGWDAFGLPAENYAIKKGIQPKITTAKNIKNAKRQVISWGVGFDWSREINTTDPSYYKWTQWLFLQFFKNGLAYEAEGEINWCPKDKTGLANEEVVNGKCERCGTTVEKRKLRQWYLRITAYAQKLLDGLKDLDWPESIKSQQVNWIGPSEGAEIDFELDFANEEVAKHDYVFLHGYEDNSKMHFWPWLKDEIKKRGGEVYAPNLPETHQPSVEEQVSFVLKNHMLTSRSIIVAHSLGTIVAQRILERIDHSIDKLVLIAPWIRPVFTDRRYPALEKSSKDWKFDFENIKSKSREIIVLSDLDDDSVHPQQPREIARNLGAKLVELKANGTHFCSEKEPMILNAIVPRLSVFTTRPDTLFGVTYMAISPEHEIISKFKNQNGKFQLKIENWTEIEDYIHKSLTKTSEDRIAAKEKTGVQIKGISAINPANGQKIPIFVADYVSADYGTGAIMAVPAHDERDFEFAKKYSVEIVKVIEGGNADGQVYSAAGKLVNSGNYSGMESEKAKQKITEAVGGRPVVRYKLRDWVFSRQRYWGEPIPLIHCRGCGVVAVPDRDLPVKLPPVKKYLPTGTGESPLAAIKSWVNTKCPRCKGPAKRETNTMPQWAGSSWYYLRYADPKNKHKFADYRLLKHWLPVDVYFGGMEHTTLHLLYSRFWHQFLYDQKLVPSAEPYAKRVPHGLILGPDGEKMSKSRGNVVNPDDVVKTHGADCLRMFELFLGPHEATVAWSNDGIVGVDRFLKRTWNLFQNHSSYKKNDKTENILPASELKRALHRAIKKIGEDIETFNFNTAVSELMKLLNLFEGAASEIDSASLDAFAKLLAPFAPHLAEEVWHTFLKNRNSIHQTPWPEFDSALIKEDIKDFVIQINGRTRAILALPAGSDESSVKNSALNDERIKRHLTADIKKTVFVKDKLLNLII